MREISASVEVKQTGKELTAQGWANQPRTKQVWRENQAGEEHKETGGKTEYWKRAKKTPKKPQQKIDTKHTHGTVIMCTPPVYVRIGKIKR